MFRSPGHERLRIRSVVGGFSKADPHTSRYPRQFRYGVDQTVVEEVAQHSGLRMVVRDVGQNVARLTRMLPEAFQLGACARVWNGYEVAQRQTPPRICSRFTAAQHWPNHVHRKLSPLPQGVVCASLRLITVFAVRSDQISILFTFFEYLPEPYRRPTLTSHLDEAARYDDSCCH